MTLHAPPVDGRATAAPCAAVIMAGGYGRRLGAITSVLPKVLVPLGEGALLDHLLEQVRQAGITEVHLLLGHHAELVRAYVDAHHIRYAGLDVRLHKGTQRLGTAGPLRVVQSAYDDWLVINGDVLTDASLGSITASHAVSGADLTVCTAQCAVAVPYAVLDVDDSGALCRLNEKPTMRYPVSAGIYVLGERARAVVGSAGALDMTDVVQRCIDGQLSVRAHALTPAAWFDLGTEADYSSALDAQLTLTTVAATGD